jgi:hypothetical protein
MSTFQLDPNQVAYGVASMGTTQVASVTNTSVQMTAFGASTTLVRIACSLGHCHYQIGTNPTASITTSTMMPNNSIEIVAVTPGQKIAFIKDSGVTSSTVSVTELV